MPFIHGAATNEYALDFTTNTPMSISDIPVVKLIEAYRLLNQKVPANTAELVFVSGVDWHYTFAAKDGRTLSQTLRFDVPTDPLLQNSNDFLRFSELELHMTVRRAFSTLITDFGCTHLEITFF